MTPRPIFKITSLALILVLSLSAAPVFGTKALYDDVSEDAWYYEEVSDLSERGLIEGDGGRFYPESTLTRAMAAMIIYRRTHREDDPEYDYTPYSDVPEGAWYARAVGWITGIGLAEGFEDGTFRPSAVLTREQLAVLLYRLEMRDGLEGSNKGESQGFEDSPQIREYALDAMDWAVSSGVLRGSGGRLYPSRPVTRAEAAVMIYRWTKLRD